MNGARSLIKTLERAGVDTCFANPGTSEMHFTAALDDVPQVRGVLGLAEGVVTGAADGYGRIAERPAATLLHLGPGLGNGLANLHNARRAHTPVVNVVGDHATYHQQYDAPLQSDIAAIAGWLEGWVRRSGSTAGLGADAAAAVAAAREGQVATLILPADVSWEDGGEVADPVPAPEPARVASEHVDRIAEVLRSGEPAAILVGGPACRRAGLLATSAIADAVGAKALIETFPARTERGAGIPVIERLPYLVEMSVETLKGIKHLIVAGTPEPVSFFAYPGLASRVAPEGAQVHTLADRSQDVVGALEMLADRLGGEPSLATPLVPQLPAGELTAANWVEVLANHIPEGAIISDESNTSGLTLPSVMAGCPPHDVLALTGGAIGQALPVAVGAAVAAPDRPVIALESDGSAMYSISALWTQARERLNVTNIILNNNAYAILRLEMQRVGAGPNGPAASALLDLSEPNIDFTKIAQGMGVPATTARTCEELNDQLADALAEPGPHLIDAHVPSLL